MLEFEEDTLWVILITIFWTPRIFQKLTTHFNGFICMHS